MSSVDSVIPCEIGVLSPALRFRDSPRKIEGLTERIPIPVHTPDVPLRTRPDRREKAVARIRARLSKRSRPRLLMLALLLVTGGAGWVTAVTLLWFGVDSMAVRYPIAVLGGYGAFLLCLRLWLRTLLRPERRRGEWDLDLTGIDAGGGGSSGGGSAPRAPGFGGGSGGGGGAGGRWDVSPGGAAPMPQPVVLPTSSMSAPMDAPGPVRTLSSSGGGGGGGKGWLSGLDLDSDSAGCLVIVLIAVAVVAIVAAAGYAFAVAPVLLAELVVDGIVIGGLYTRVRRIDGDWLRAAIRRTWIPALLLAALLGLVGYGIQSAMPGARSIGDVWRQPADG